MGNVAVTLKIMPESPSVSIPELKKEIENAIAKFPHARLQRVYENPIAFGLVALQVLLVLPDNAGGTDDIETALTEINGVASVESEGVTLI